MRKLDSKTNVTAPDSNFQYGRIKNDTGLSDGTPVNEEVYGDFHQFFERLMAEGNVTANGLPESTTNGFQLNEALFNLAVKPQLAALGIFQTVDTDLTYTLPQTMQAMAAYEDILYIANFDGVNYSVNRFWPATGVELAFVFSASNIGGVAVDSGFLWVFIDGASKSIKAYDLTTGIEDATRAVTLASSSFAGFRAANGLVYIGDNTNNVIKTYSQADGSFVLDLGAALPTIVDFQIKGANLYYITSAGNTCTIINALLGTAITSFAVTPATTDLLSIEIYADKVYFLYGGAVVTKIAIYNANTFQFYNLDSNPILGGGQRSISIANNKQYRMQSNTVNRIDVYNQEFNL